MIVTLMAARTALRLVELMFPSCVVIAVLNVTVRPLNVVLPVWLYDA